MPLTLEICVSVSGHGMHTAERINGVHHTNANVLGKGGHRLEQILSCGSNSVGATARDHDNPLGRSGGMTALYIWHRSLQDSGHLEVALLRIFSIRGVYVETG